MQRRPELMRHVREKFGFCPAGPLSRFLGMNEIGRPGIDQFLKMVTMLSQLGFRRLGPRNVTPGAPVTGEFASGIEGGGT